MDRISERKEKGEQERKGREHQKTDLLRTT